MPKVKRLAKLVHPNSRKALEMASKEHQKLRLSKVKEDTKNKQSLLIRKLAWFKSKVSSGEGDEEKMSVAEEESSAANAPTDFASKQQFTNQDLHNLVDLYFHRFEEEMVQINTKKSIGKRSIGQHFSREKAIEITLCTEKNEYETSGIAVPDLVNPDNLKFFRAWNGEASLLQNIKLKNLKKNSK